MNQEQFLQQLRAQLSPLPPEERERYVEDYREMLLDRTEEGMSQEEAVRSLGAPEEIAGQILLEVPLGALLKERIKPKRRRSGWEIALLILGFPLWFPLLLAAGILLLAGWIVVCALLFAVVVTGVALIAAGPVGIVAGGAQLSHGMTGEGLVTLGLGLFSAGLGILLLLAGINLTRAFFRWLSGCLRRIFLSKKEDESHA